MHSGAVPWHPGWWARGFSWSLGHSGLEPAARRQARSCRWVRARGAAVQRWAASHSLQERCKSDNLGIAVQITVNPVERNIQVYFLCLQLRVLFSCLVFSAWPPQWGSSKSRDKRSRKSSFQGRIRLLFSLVCSLNWLIGSQMLVLRKDESLKMRKEGVVQQLSVSTA